MSENADFKQKILVCLKSSEDFKKNNKYVREELLKKNKETITAFLDIIEGHITSKDGPAEARFYSLYFLKINTESSHDHQLLSAIANRKTLLKSLEEQATFDKDIEFPERGSMFFKTNPNQKEKSAGSNYLALLLEIIKYWNQKYASDEKKSNPFGVLYRKLVEEHKVPFPTNYYFYKSKELKSRGGTLIDLNSTISQASDSGDTRSQRQQLQQSEEQQLKDSVPSTKKQESLRVQISQAKVEYDKKEGKNDQSEDVKNAKQKLTNLKNSFRELKEFYDLQKIESNDVEALISVYYENLAESHKPFEEIIRILTSNDQQNEEVVHEILQFNERALDLTHNFKKYNDKQIKYSEHRSFALKILESENPTPSGMGAEETSLEKNQSPSRIFSSNRETFGIIDAATSGRISAENNAGTFADRNMEKKQLNLKEEYNAEKLQNMLNGAKQDPLEEEKEQQMTQSNSDRRRGVQDKPKQGEENNQSVHTSKKHVQDSKATLFSFDSNVKDTEGAKVNANPLIEQKKSGVETNKEVKKVVQIEDFMREEALHREESPKRIELFNRGSKREELVLREEKIKREGSIKQDDMLSMKEENKRLESLTVEDRKSLTRQEVKKGDVRFSELVTTDQPSPKFSKVTSRRPPVLNEDTSSKETPVSSNMLPADQKNSSQSTNRAGVIQSKLLQKGVDSTTLTAIKKEAKGQIETKTQNLEELQEEKALILQKIKSQEEEKKSMAQSLKPTLIKSQTVEEKPNQQQQNLSKLMKPSQNSSMMRFSSDPKSMEKSLKLVRDQFADLKKIQEGIKRSFATSQKKLPPMLSENFLANQDILSKFEQELHLLRNENEELRSSTIVAESGNQDKSLQPAVSELQKQIAYFKKEIEQLKKRNEQLEKGSPKQTDSPNETTKRRLQELEAENKTLKKKMEANLTAKTQFEETQVLHDKIKKLSQENELLTNSMAELKRDNQSMHSKMIEYEEILGYSKAHIRPDESRGTLKTEERHSAMRNHMLEIRPDSPQPQVLSSQISPKESAQLDWLARNKSPDNKTFWNGLKEQLSPIQPLQHASQGGMTSEKHERFQRDPRINSPIEIIDSYKTLNWRNEFAPTRTNNVEIGKRATGINNRFQSDWNKGRDGPNVEHQQNNSNISQVSSDPNDRFETPDEELSGAEELLESITKEQAPPRHNFFARETGSQANLASRDEDHQPHHIFSSHRWLSSNEGENEQEQGQNFVEVSDQRGYDYEWVQKLSNKVGELTKNPHRKNPFESEPEFTEELKGTIISSNLHAFEEFNKHLQSVGSSQTLHQFKMACLKSKCPVFENNELQIGASTSVVQDYSTRKHQLKLALFFNNKSHKPITSFTAVLTEGLNLEIAAKPEIIESVITTSKQVKQILLMSFKTIPISCLKLKCSAICDKQPLNFTIILPTTMNKFMELKYVEADEFKGKWRTYASNTFKTEEVHLDPTVIRNAHDFKKYFAYLVDLEPEDEYDFIRGNKSIKLGGVFDLKEPGSEYVLQINYLPSQAAVFQIATAPKNVEYAKFIIQNLVFLFKK